MPKITVHTREGVREIAYEGTPNLLELLLLHGIDIPHACGGNGMCYGCKAAINGEVAPACQVRLRGDKEIILRGTPEFERYR